MQNVLAEIERQFESGDLIGGAQRLRNLIELPENLSSLVPREDDEVDFHEYIGLLMSLMIALKQLSEAIARSIFTEILEVHYIPLLVPPYSHLPQDLQCLNIFLAVLSTLDILLNDNITGSETVLMKAEVSSLQIKLVDAYLYLRPSGPALAVWADFLLIPLIFCEKLDEARILERAHPKLCYLPKDSELHKLVSKLYPIE